MENNSVSSKVDDNKNYVSIYGNNSLGVVSFAGGVSLTSKLVKKLTSKEPTMLSQLAKMVTREGKPRFNSDEIFYLSKLSDKNPLVVLDARKNKGYLYYDNEIKGAVDIDEIQKIINSGAYDVITDNKLQSILGGKSYQQKNYPLGEILSELVVEKLKTKSGNWAELLPLYIQPPPMG